MNYEYIQALLSLSDWVDLSAWGYPFEDKMVKCLSFASIFFFLIFLQPTFFCFYAHLTEDILGLRDVLW